MTKVVTHGGEYHTDDVFAVALLDILFDDLEIVRVPRGEEIPDSEYVVDVGKIYDPGENKFDHHQKGGAGERDNGVPYASFGLVWKKFALDLCKSEEVSEYVDKKLVQPVDASDNGFQYFESYGIVNPYLIQRMFSAFNPTWKEDASPDEAFNHMLKIAKEIILREVEIATHFLEAKKDILNTYNSSLDKRIIVFGEEVPYGSDVGQVLADLGEPVYAVFYKQRDKKWQVLAISKEPGTQMQRKSLPENWRGKEESELKEITGFDGISFVHNSGFMLICDDKETAISLAKLALES